MYRIEDYDRPSVAADAVVFGFDTADAASRGGLKQRKLKLLLVKRGEEPFRGAWSLPGGFLQRGETVEQAALRELSEETGVSNPKIMHLRVFSAPDRDPRGWVISCAFLALTKTVALSTVSGSDAAAACWADFVAEESNGCLNIRLTAPDGTPLLDRYGDAEISNLLAFDHAAIIAEGFRRLRDEVIHHDMIFDLMPELFAISDLQQPYEAITGMHTSSQNFRKKMAPKLQETEFFNEAAAHRTARLYRRKDGLS